MCIMSSVTNIMAFVIKTLIEKTGDIILDLEWLLTCSLMTFFLLFVLFMVLLGLFYNSTSTYTHFSIQNMPHVRPLPFFGNMRLWLMGQQSYSDYILDTYNKLGENPYQLQYFFQLPVVFLKDPDIIKDVTVNHFHHFTDRRPVYIENRGPIWKTGLPHLNGARWNDTRRLLAPIFSPAKVKTMFGKMTQCSNQLISFLQESYKKKVFSSLSDKDKGTLQIDMRGLFEKYSVDVIATTVFGVKVDSFNDPQHKFYRMANKLTNFDGVQGYKWLGFITGPKLMMDLGFKLLPEKLTEYFKTLVLGKLTRRFKDDIKRTDILQVLLDAWKSTAENNETRMDDDDVVAQTLVFFVAAFNSSTILLSSVSHMLAVHPEIQTKLQGEIDRTLKANGGELTYEILNNMKYLDMVISETLRLHPPAPTMDRTCVRHYTLERESRLELRPGDYVLIPIYGLHRDPNNFPSPESFDPERFSEENKHKIKPSTYLPFGQGPRSCIGVHFALIEAKTVLVHLLSKFNLKVISKTPIPLKIIQKGFSMNAKDGFWLGLEPRTL